MAKKKSRRSAVPYFALGIRLIITPITCKSGERCKTTKPGYAIAEGEPMLEIDLGVIPEIPQPPSKADAGEKWKDERTLVDYIYIPEGPFQYGQEKEIRTTPGFWIAETPTTVAQYKLFCKETTTPLPQEPSWGWAGKEDHPIVYVNWMDSRKYARWAGGDLPRELMWEKAARGTDGRIYPWGDDWDASKCQCNAQSTSSVYAHPEGASPYGVLDMSGNVWEWCLDAYQS